MARTFEGDIPRFNERFYAGNPAAYLQARLDQWMATAEDAGAFSAVRVRSSTDPGLSDNSAVDPAMLSFLTADTVVLHHHAAETVVRYYLAHVGDQPVPWTEIAGQRGGFNELVRKRLIDGSPTPAEAANVVYGVPKPQPFADADEWETAVAGVIEFLVSMAHTYIDGAPMYNSLKHGLGAAAGRTDVAFVEELADPSRPTVAEIQAGHHLGSGPRVEYPTFDKSGGATEWSIVTEWVDVERSIRLIVVAIGLLRSIRGIGQLRRRVASDSDQSSVTFFTPGPFRASNMHSPGRTPGHSMSQVVLRVTEQ
jgi:hypothetical protein